MRKHIGMHILFALNEMDTQVHTSLKDDIGNSQQRCIVQRLGCTKGVQNSHRIQTISPDEDMMGRLYQRSSMMNSRCNCQVFKKEDVHFRAYWQRFDGVEKAFIRVDKWQSIAKTHICPHHHVSIVIRPHALISEADPNGRRNDILQPHQVSDDSRVDGDTTMRPGFSTDFEVQFCQSWVTPREHIQHPVQMASQTLPNSKGWGMAWCSKKNVNFWDNIRYGRWG